MTQIMVANIQAEFYIKRYQKKLFQNEYIFCFLIVSTMRLQLNWHINTVCRLVFSLLLNGLDHLSSQDMWSGCPLVILPDLIPAFTTSLPDASSTSPLSPHLHLVIYLPLLHPQSTHQLTCLVLFSLRLSPSGCLSMSLSCRVSCVSFILTETVLNPTSV